MSLRFSLRWSPCTHLDLFKFKLYKEALCSHIWEFSQVFSCYVPVQTLLMSISTLLSTTQSSNQATILPSPPPASRLQGPALIPITAAIPSND